MNKDIVLERHISTILGDIKMMVAARDIRKYLTEFCPDMQSVLSDRPNTVYGHTLDGLVLYADPNCSPSAVGTPYGTWRAVGGGCPPPRGWFREVEERLGLVEVHAAYETKGVTGGYHEPVYAITRDLEGNMLPPTVYRQVGHRIGRLCENLFESHDVSMDEQEVLLDLAIRIRRRANGLPVEMTIMDIIDREWDKIEPSLGDWRFVGSKEKV